MADYVETKLTNLKALKELATKLKDEVDAAKTAAGDKNKIEIIKVNGAVQSITDADKSVDIKVPTKVAELTDNANYATKEEMKAQLGSVYTPGGSTVFDEMPEATVENLGKVYNVTDEFTTTADFLEGEGKKYPAGTNVVIVEEDSEVYKYDVLSGLVDLTNYVTKDGSKQLSTEDFTTALKNKLNGLTNYTHPTSEAGAKAEGLYKITTDETGHVTAATEVIKTDITALGIPDKDTTYTDVTAGSESGLMSGGDKTKLDGLEIADDAEVTAMLAEVFPA